MNNTNTYDVLVVGAGLAGLSAATKAASTGLRVCVLEQGAEEPYLCNTRYTGGLFHIAMEDLLAPPETAKATLLRATNGETRTELVDALIENVPRAMQWLKELGVRFIVAGPDGLRRNSLSPPGVRQTGLHWQGRAGDVLLRTLAQGLARHGGAIELGVKATSLIMQEGRCKGLVAEKDGKTVEYRATFVVLADGGFQADAELVQRYISPRPQALLQRNAQSGRGSGIRMAEAAGAKLVGMDRFYGHVQYRAALNDERFWPYPVLDSLATAGLVIDATGKRFCDEGGGGVYIANEIARLAQPDRAWIIFDQATWDGPGRNWLLPANPYLLSAGGELTSAGSITDLAGKISLAPDVLQYTIDNYNRMVDSGVQETNQPPRTVASYKSWAVRHGPFHALPVCAGITYTMGGMLTDPQARVLDVHEQAIPGLYAAGATTGGLEGGGMAGYSGGLSKSATFGFLAGESIARTMGRISA